MHAWIDAHCHLTSRFHPEPLPKILEELHKARCQGFVLGGVDPLDWQEQLAIPDSPLEIIRVFGLHPWTIQARPEEQLQQDFAALERLLPLAQGLGECGLDFYRCRRNNERQQQTAWFIKQVDLAISHDKPCVLHIVRAHHEGLRVIKSYGGKARGLVHSFWANTQTARSWLDLGFMLSLHPRIRHNDSHGLIAYVPPDRILFESDSPEIFNDGRASDPRFCLEIMQYIAEIKDVSIDSIIRQQRVNLQQLFPQIT